MVGPVPRFTKRLQGGRAGGAGSQGGRNSRARLVAAGVSGNSSRHRGTGVFPATTKHDRRLGFVWFAKSCPTSRSCRRSFSSVCIIPKQTPESTFWLQRIALQFCNRAIQLTLVAVFTECARARLSGDHFGISRFVRERRCLPRLRGEIAMARRVRVSSLPRAGLLAYDAWVVL